MAYRLFVGQPGPQAHLETAAVGQTGERVYIGLVTQRLDVTGVLFELPTQPRDHVVHGADHTAQLRAGRQLRLADEFATLERFGLVDQASSGRN